MGAQLLQESMSLQSAARTSESTTMRILEEVAATRDVEPGALSPPLGSVIDPDALEAIVGTRPDSDVAVQFTYADCRISVTANEVAVHDLRGEQ